MSLVGSRVGRIRIDALIGTGGMGEVYRGFDEALERPVAVKALRADRRLSDEAKARFLREARLLSKLDHPGICRIYDLVERDDADLLVLEHIQGQTLGQAVAGGLDLDQGLRIAQLVARALAAAHRERIVHRDLKPDNVMITADGGVKVLDFGIARTVSPELPAAARTPRGPGADGGSPAEDGATAGLTGYAVPEWSGEVPPGDAGELQSTMFTREGLILGTVRFMSPEQAVGGAVAESSDMYSFGVMLHELVTGRPAYGPVGGAELLLRVAAAQTEPLVDVDPDLADLVDRLENLDPRRRPTAVETAERLAWVLDRPSRARRRRLRAVVGVVLAGAVVTGAGSVIWGRIQARRQAAAAQAFAADAKDIEWLMRAEHLSPAHDVRPAKEEVLRRMASLEAAMKDLGPVGQGPGHGALGRGNLALGRLEKAREHLEMAWDSGHRPAEVAWALGDVLGRLYQREVERARSIPDPSVRDEELRRVQQELRQPAVEVLRHTQGRDRATEAYLRGRIALYEERFDEGLEQAAEAASASPWFYEADLLAGDLHYQAAAWSSTRSDSEAVVRHLGHAAEAYRRAAQTGRSDPQVQLSLCATGVRLATELDFAQQAAPAAERLESSLEPCVTALRLDPGLATAHAEMAALHVLIGRAQQRHGADPSATFHRAREAAQTALELEPDNPRALALRGWVSLWYGWYRLRSGEDAAADLDRAAADLGRLLEMAPHNLAALMNLINSCEFRALNESSLGRDPLPWLDRGIELVESALVRLPDNASFHVLAGRHYLSRGRYQVAHGRDPEPSFRRAVEEYTLLASGEATAEAHRDLALARVDLGDALQAKGLDPTATYSLALEEVDRALAVNPGYGLPQMVGGLAHFGLARWAAQCGRDPDTHLASAVGSYDEGLAQAPTNVDAYAELAQILLLRASLRLDRDQSPEADLDRARALVAEGLRLNPTLTANHLAAARAELLRVRWALHRGGQAGPPLAAAEAALGRGLETNRSDAGLHHASAELALWRARSNRQNPGAMAADVIDGLEAVREALAVNPRLAEAELTRAELLLLRAETDRTARGEALEALARAEQINPMLRRRCLELAGR